MRILDTSHLAIGDTAVRYCALCGELHQFTVWTMGHDGIPLGRAPCPRYGQVGKEYTQYLDRDYPKERDE